MASKDVIGIDFGTYEIKILRYNIKEGSITSVHRIRRESNQTQDFDNDKTGVRETPTEANPETNEGQSTFDATPAWHQTLVDYLADSNQSEIFVNAPDSIAATLRIDVPFSDSVKVASVIPHLISDKLPLDAKHTIFDFLAYDTIEGSESPAEAIIGFSRKKDIENFLNSLKDLGIDPALVAVPSLSLAAYAAAKYQADQVVAYLDIGHETSSFTVLQNGNPIVARSIRGGGDKITRLIAERFGQTYVESENIKHKFAAIVNKDDLSLNDQTRLVSAIIVEGLAPVLRDVRRSLQGLYASNGTEVSGLQICGGTSQIKNIEPYFSNELGVKTRRFKSETQGDQAGELVMGAALVECGRSEKILRRNPNLRKGDLAYTGGGSAIRKRMIRFGIVAGILVLFLVGIFFLQKMAQEARRDAMKNVLAVESKKLFGKKTMSVKKVREALASGEGDSQSFIPKASAFELLHDLTRTISSEVDLTLSRVEVDLPRKIMQFNGSTTDAQAVDRIVSDLREIECLKKVTPGATRVKNDKANFDIQITSGCS